MILQVRAGGWRAEVQRAIPTLVGPPHIPLRDAILPVLFFFFFSYPTDNSSPEH